MEDKLKFIYSFLKEHDLTNTLHHFLDDIDKSNTIPFSSRIFDEESQTPIVQSQNLLYPPKPVKKMRMNALSMDFKNIQQNGFKIKNEVENLEESGFDPFDQNKQSLIEFVDDDELNLGNDIDVVTEEDDRSRFINSNRHLDVNTDMDSLSRNDSFPQLNPFETNVSKHVTNYSNFKKRFSREEVENRETNNLFSKRLQAELSSPKIKTSKKIGDVYQPTYDDGSKLISYQEIHSI